MNIKNMIKIIWVLLAVIGLHAYANVKFIQDDLVGIWKCTIEYDYGTRMENLTTLDKMNADGTMTQFAELIVYDNQNTDGDNNRIDVLSIKNNWQLKNNRLEFTDYMVVDYRGFDDKKVPYIEFFQREYKKLYQGLLIKDNGYEIKILNGDLFEIIPENTDDIMINYNTYCQRIS